MIENEIRMAQKIKAYKMQKKYSGKKLKLIILQAKDSFC